jgi:hypothetical protein
MEFPAPKTADRASVRHPAPASWFEDAPNRSSVYLSNSMFSRLIHLPRKLQLVSAVIAAVLCTSAAALSPPSPPPPTIAEIVESTQVVFTGRVEGVKWLPIRLDTPGAGYIALKVRVTERLRGNARTVPKRIIYFAGSVSMSEAQTKERYEGHSFVFVGDVFRLTTGETKVMLPPSGDRPYELSTTAEFKRQIARLNKIGGRHESLPGAR